MKKRQQKTLLSYSNFSSTIHKTTTSSSNFKCQICGISFNVKHTYLTHLKKCSNQNSIQLKHAINFATMVTKNIDESKMNTRINKTKEKTIKNRIIKMEIPKTEDDEQQQLVKNLMKIF